MNNFLSKFRKFTVTQSDIPSKDTVKDGDFLVLEMEARENLFSPVTPSLYLFTGIKPPQRITVIYDIKKI